MFLKCYFHLIYYRIKHVLMFVTHTPMFFFTTVTCTNRDRSLFRNRKLGRRRPCCRWSDTHRRCSGQSSTSRRCRSSSSPSPRSPSAAEAATWQGAGSPTSCRPRRRRRPPKTGRSDGRTSRRHPGRRRTTALRRRSTTRRRSRTVPFATAADMKAAKASHRILRPLPTGTYVDFRNRPAVSPARTLASVDEAGRETVSSVDNRPPH